MRYILALVPPKNYEQHYIQASQRLFSDLYDGYLLSEKSSPHITICQFKCANNKEVVKVWEQVEKLDTLSLQPRFLGIGFEKGTGAHQAFYWAAIAVARDEAIMKLHRDALRVIQSLGYTCLNDSNDLYRPHLTLARILLPDRIQKWPETLLDSTGGEFRLALAQGDENGQYIKTVFEH